MLPSLAESFFNQNIGFLQVRLARLPTLCFLPIRWSLTPLLFDDDGNATLPCHAVVDCAVKHSSLAG